MSANKKLDMNQPNWEQYKWSNGEGLASLHRVLIHMAPFLSTEIAHPSSSVV
uniref:Uncharacterized protein n=1 Tax=Arion vulgaris TaxID=1028688 RepID=A0A0B7BC47_9EUPU